MYLVTLEAQGFLWHFDYTVPGAVRVTKGLTCQN